MILQYRRTFWECCGVFVLLKALLIYSVKTLFCEFTVSLLAFQLILSMPKKHHISYRYGTLYMHI